MSAAITASMLAAPAPIQFDLNRPYRTRSGRAVLNLRQDGNFVRFQIEGEPSRALHAKRVDNGCSYPQPRDALLLDDDLVNLVEDTTYTRRSLRPDREYQLRDGRAVEIVSWDADPAAPILAMFSLLPHEKASFPGRSKLVVEYHKSGRVEPNGRDHAHDILEINKPVTRWVRAYDEKPVNDKGKRELSGKSFNAAIPLHWYVFDTELEARASLQGVRAVFPITYNEGEGVV